MTFNSENFPGRVCLVGAGPGDPGLITVRGLDRLRAADVIVYDALVLPSLLREARADAVIIDVGKRHADHKMTQEEINALLLEQAKSGRFVVRLKGGDPFVFGRGAEEAVYLARHDVHCEIVPGVTAGVAAPAMAGIPVTHRHFASSVTFVTGHEDPAKSKSVTDLKALASLVKTGGTLCIYMGMNRLDALTDELLQHGLPPETPAAIVEWGATPRQQSLRTTLDRLSSQVVEESLRAPAIIIIGRVVAIEEPGLDAYVQRPLFGRRIIITRTREQAGDLRLKLESLGAEVLEAPTIATQPMTADAQVKVDAALRSLADYDWLALTSVNGVEAMARRIAALGLDGRAFAKVRIAVIGDATAAALQARLGLRADLVPAKFVAEELAAALTQADAKGKRFLLLRADIARQALPRLLIEAGGSVDDLPIYRTLPAAQLPVQTVDALRQGDIDWITFTSSSTVRHLIALLGEDRGLLGRVKIASIGPITTATLREAGLMPTVEAAQSNIDGLVAAMTNPSRDSTSRGRAQPEGA